MRQSILPFSIIVIVIIGFFAVVGTKSYRMQNNAHDHYKPAEAIITRSEVACSPSKNVHCQALITYKYTVADQLYNADRIAYISNKITINEQVQQFPLGTHVTAYFDPTNPAEAILDNSAWPLTRLAKMLIQPLIILIVIIIIWRLAIKRLSKIITSNR